MLAMLEYLIVCPFVFLGGFVDAVAGGGGLISLPAYMIAGLSPLMLLVQISLVRAVVLLWLQCDILVADLSIGESLFRQLFLP